MSLLHLLLPNENANFFGLWHTVQCSVFQYVCCKQLHTQQEAGDGVAELWGISAPHLRNASAPPGSEVWAQDILLGGEGGGTAPAQRRGDLGMSMLALHFCVQTLKAKSYSGTC